MAYSFLKVDGVNGESKDTNHDQWIEILSCSKGVIQKLSMAGSTHSLGTTGAEFQEVMVTKETDSSTPTLWQYCADGKPIASVEIELCEAQAPQKPYLKVTLENCRISSFQFGYSDGAGKPSETVNFAYEKETLKYTDTTDDTEYEKYFDLKTAEAG